MPPCISLDWAHPLVRDWFVARFGTPTEPQEQGWPSILAGQTTLLSAPTGSGKTLAAFLVCIDQLVRKALRGELADRTEVVYVSPLKALSNDVHKNLEVPLAEIAALAGERGILMPPIRTAVRTGDTLASERRAMLSRPPHILVTTPESLYILLTATSSREILRAARTVIVDEIHAVADDKRGAHLSLSLERLERLSDAPLSRIGLSATQKPIELVAQFLTGSGRSAPVVVHIPNRREIDISIEVPGSELGPIASHEMWNEIYDRLAALATQHRSTLVFVNTRRLAERLAHHLGERLGKNAVAAHHGSLSRKLRLTAEKQLKAGELRALVATASLELGIDIGHVDLVCQIGSPRSIAVGLQRIGRAGHWRGAVPKGRVFATTRDDLIECAALVRAIRQGDLDRLIIPDAPLDILAQQIVAACAAEDWREDDLFDFVHRAYSYRQLPRSAFDEIIDMLSEGIAAARGRYAAYLHRDRVNGIVRARRGSRLAAITSGGAIPETSLYSVIAQPEGAIVGTVDEDFAVESMAGDIMLLGSTSWRIRRVQSGSVLVEDAQGAPPNIPFWRGEAPARTDELSAQVSCLREEISARMPEPIPQPFSRENVHAVAAAEWLQQECALDRSGAEQAVEYIATGRALLHAVPTQTTVIAERFFDESGGMQLIIHAPFGARINKAWGLALRKRFCRSFNFELQAAATDNGLNISLGEQHSFPLADVFHFLHPNSVRHVLEQAVLASPFFTTRWRWDAGRALALLRYRGGKKVPPPIQRMRADDLLAAVFPAVLACRENMPGDVAVSDHPLIREVMNDIFTEALDLEGLERVLHGITDGRIQCLALDTPMPSQFSHEILNANPYAYLDDAPLEERRARAVDLRRTLPEAALGEIGRLDPAAIAEVRDDVWPDVRDAEELHDALLSLIALPIDADETAGHPAARLCQSLPEWNAWLDHLAANRRIDIVRAGDHSYWVAAERAHTFLQAFPSAQLPEGLPHLESQTISREDALAALATGWLTHTGPITAQQLAGLLGLSPSDADKTLLHLEATGAILRGQFTDPAAPTEWCERRLLARIHRLTIGRLRKQIEPVTPAQFMHWLLRWQHVATGSQLLGEHGLLEALSQLQGFEAPARSWEPQLLARRVANYDPKLLDQLCLTGMAGWGRLSQPSAWLEGPIDGKRRVTPTSVTPITFFIREEADWMARHRSSEERPPLSPVAVTVLNFLHARGASFFADIVRATGHLKSEVEAALWELVAAGLLTADGFDNLRALIDPKRRAGRGSARSARPRHSAGRWSLLHSGEDAAASSEAICWMLLRRYGIVFRELLARETVLPRWRELLIAFRRLEDRGEIRGGRFVSGFVGEQFALPVAVESVRAMRNQQPFGQLTTISAADPLNLVGILVPGDRIAANSGKTVSFRDGVPVIADEKASGLHIAVAG
jgi:ATP-dependent Lhr-like helicase